MFGSEAHLFAVGGPHCLCRFAVAWVGSAVVDGGDRVRCDVVVHLLPCELDPSAVFDVSDFAALGHSDYPIAGAFEDGGHVVGE